MGIVMQEEERERGPSKRKAIFWWLMERRGSERLHGKPERGRGS